MFGPQFPDSERLAFANANCTDQNIRVSVEDLTHFPGREEETVALPDGGYLGTLNVFHELHCIVGLLLPYWTSPPFPSSSTTNIFIYNTNRSFLLETAPTFLLSRPLLS